MLRRCRVLLLLGFLGTIRLVRSAEQEVPVVSVNASRWERRNSTNKGCGPEGGDGCSADYTVDGLLNDVPESRWSCDVESEYALPVGNPCVIDFDMGSSYALVSVEIYFHQSNDEGRHMNSFTLGVAETAGAFTVVTSGASVIPTPLGEGNNFPLGSGVTGRFVRMTSTTDDEWLSVNEVKIFADISTPAPVPLTAAPVVTPTSQPAVPTAAPETPAPLATIAPTPANIVTPSPLVLASPPPTIMPAPGNLATLSPSAPASPASTAMPSPGHVTTPSPSGGCATLTVTGAGFLSGEFLASEGTGNTKYIASEEEVGAKILLNNNEESECSSSSESDCTTRKWSIWPDNRTAHSVYQVFDEASHPALIDELWLRVECSSNGNNCIYSPADVRVVCQDGSITAAPTPAPATASTCAVVELSGTIDEKWDGFYQAQTDENGDSSIFVGYDVTNGGATVTANGNELSSHEDNGGCSNAASDSSSTGCVYQQWKVTGNGSEGRTYFTYDASNHPADIAPGLWYTQSTTLLPYDGEVTVSCASSLMATLMPIEPLETTLPGSPTPAPEGSGVGLSGDDSSSDAVSMAVIAGCAGGGLGLLILVAGVVVWRQRVALPQHPPPSYNDLVGSGK